MLSCQTFKDTVGGLDTRSLEGLINAYIANSSPDTETALSETLVPLKTQSEAFIKEYQERAKEMLGAWYFPDKSSKLRTDFLNTVAFEGDTQKVIITKTLSIPRVAVEYFPALIKGVKGDLYLSNVKAPSIEGLEFVDGNLRLENNDRLAVIPKLKKVGEAFIIKDSNVYLPALETIGEIFFVEKYHQPTIPNLRKIGGSFRPTDTDLTALDNLEEIGGNAVIDEKITSLKKLRTVGENLEYYFNRSLRQFPTLETVGRNISISKIPDDLGDRYQTFIEEVFPKLVSVGIDMFGKSFFVDSKPLQKELLKLQQSNKIHFTGTVGYTGK